MSRAREKGRVFLLEIGTEEIPARMIGPALRDLGAGLHLALARARLLPEPGGPGGDSPGTFGTPRRLAVLIEGLLARQPDAVSEVTGPPVAAALDAQGRPTRAAEGFARAQGVAVADLVRVKTPKGECLAARRTVPGRPAAEVLAEVVPAVVGSLSFPKTMRWGLGDHRFVRPVHSVVALLDGDLVALTIAGVRSGRETFGRRFAGRPRIPLETARDYVGALRAGHVLADVAERRGRIEESLGSEARRHGGVIAAPAGRPAGSGDPELLEEVTQLVEWPLVIAGEFDSRFLELPADVLITAMRHHQKYFSLRDPNGALMNRFLAVANCVADRTGAVRRGNEWVLRARLADARFFWEEDRKLPLAARSPALARVTFHEKLGSYAAKAERLAHLAAPLAEAFARSGQAIDREAAAQAAALCKNDLTTQMVNEFPELEGIVGGLYARADGLPPAVCEAIYGHYLPRGADDPVPPTPEGGIVSLADRLDTQAGIFLLGIVPTGSRDPYALRRSVQGACRILIERKVNASLERLLEQAFSGYGTAVQGGAPTAEARAALLEFYRGRQQFLAEEEGLRADAVRAALASSADDPLDVRLRARALDQARREPGFEDLAVAHKRIKNILGARPEGRLDPGRLREEAERALHRHLEAARPRLDAALEGRDYRAALQEIARLRPHLDRFFKEVMVMAEDPATRDNRVALLSSMAALFLRVGDFSELVPEAEPAGSARRTGA